MSQISCFLGGHKGRELGTGWVAGAKKPKQQAQLCHALAVTLDRLLPSGPPRPPGPEQGRSEPLLEAGTMVSPGQATKAALSDTQGRSHAGRGPWGCGERAWRQGRPAGDHLGP